MLWQIALLVVALTWIWSHFRNRGDNPLDKLPGPKRLPIIGNSYAFIGLSNRELFEKLMDMPKQYGHRYVINVFNRYILHIANINDVEVVLSHSRNITKNKPYKFLEPWLGTGLLLSTGSKWHKRRKILTPSFHFNILKNFSKVMEENSQHMVEKLMEKVKNGSEVVELMPFISDCTLCTICETAMGTQLGSDKSNATVKYKEEILNIGIITMQRLTRMWLHTNFVFKMSTLGKRFAKCLDIVHSFSDNVILERKMAKQKEDKPFSVEDDSIGGKRRLALLDLLLESESKGEIDLEGIREEVNTFMFEGHDTTAMALTFGLMLLADHEEVQERIFEECTTIFGDSKRTPGLTDQAEMKYLEAVIKEILRLYPSVPFVGRELTEDLTLEGNLVVKKGTEIVVHIYDLHRRADVYPDPEAFKPERFFGSENRHPYAFVPFSAGPRNCIGQRFAMQEMKCILSQVIRNFKLAPIKKGARPALIADLVLRPYEPIYVKFIPR
ncbi:cytochrome P450 4C1-like [Epargyreus clarus]|uniref:cytochrome P450 4C1-like n=1 Tax=Epargyreus clarus TaxID=520877 RepID=UPI003C2E51D2